MKEKTGIRIDNFELMPITNKININEIKIKKRILISNKNLKKEAVDKLKSFGFIESKLDGYLERTSSTTAIQH